MHPYQLLSEREAQLHQQDRRREAEKWRQAHAAQPSSRRQWQALRALMSPVAVRLRGWLARVSRAQPAGQPQMRKV
jgi:hypothetical protein